MPTIAEIGIELTKLREGRLRDGVSRRTGIDLNRLCDIEEGRALVNEHEIDLLCTDYGIASDRRQRLIEMQEQCVLAYLVNELKR